MNTTSSISLARQSENRRPNAAKKSTSNEPRPALQPFDLLYREEKEAVVNSSGKASIAAARALYDIDVYGNGILYKSEFRTFELYGHERWGYGKSQCYRLLEAGSFIDLLVRHNSPIGEKLPINECQIRALFGTVPKEYRLECWLEIIAGKSPAELTGKMICKEARAFVQKHGLETKRPKQTKTDVRVRAVREIKKLRSILAELSRPERFDQTLAQLIDMIEIDPFGDAVDVEATVVEQSAGVDRQADPMRGVSDGPFVQVAMIA